MTGIYKFTNKINGKIYIGQSCNIETRIRKHFDTAFRPNIIPECYIDRAIRKYGKENFIIEIVEECPLDKLNEQEIYWIKFFDSFNKKTGYNLTLGGDSGVIYDRCKIQQLWNSGLSKKEIMQEMQISQSGMTNILKELKIDPKEIQKRRSQLIAKRPQQYTLTGEYVATYNTLQDAANHFAHGNVTSISAVCCQRGKFKSAYGYLWKYEDDERDISEWVERYNACNNKVKMVYQYDKDYNFVDSYSSAKKANEITGANRNKIGEVCRGTRKTAGGYIWSYLPPDRFIKEMEEKDNA